MVAERGTCRGERWGGIQIQGWKHEAGVKNKTERNERQTRGLRRSLVEMHKGERKAAEAYRSIERRLVVNNIKMSCRKVRRL